MGLRSPSRLAGPFTHAQGRKQPFAENWGDGTTSSSDGQRFKAGGNAESPGHINPKYGVEPDKLFYPDISD
jgi:TnpA family transposase